MTDSAENSRRRSSPPMVAGQLPTGRTLRIRPGVVKALRVQKGWGVKDLAARAICSVKTIENLERGKPAYLTTLMKVAKALGAGIDALLENPSTDAVQTPEAGKQQVKVEVTFKLSMPSFDEFDETSDLVLFIKYLQRIVGKDQLFDDIDVSKGSVIIKLTMTEQASEKLYHEMPARLPTSWRWPFRRFGIRRFTIEECYDMHVKGGDQASDRLISAGDVDDAAGYDWLK